MSFSFPFSARILFAFYTRKDDKVHVDDDHDGLRRIGKEERDKVEMQ